MTHRLAHELNESCKRMRNSHEETHLCILREKKLPNLRFLSARDEHKAIFPYFCSQNSMNHAKELSHRGVSRESEDH